MHIRPRHVIRAGLIAGLALTTFPAAGVPWLPARDAGAAPAAIRGLSPELIAGAAKHPAGVVLLLRSGVSPHDSSVLDTLRAAGATNIGSLDLINGISADVTATADYGS